MSRKRKPDNLDLDSARAMEAGYGVHYGLYKAAHPITKEEPRVEIRMEKCGWCGREYPYRPRKKYCCEDCRKAAGRAENTN